MNGCLDEEPDLYEAVDACRALAAGLLGVCWGMAYDVMLPSLADGERREGWFDPVLNLRNPWHWKPVMSLWLLDQARPAGCRAPWEDD